MPRLSALFTDYAGTLDPRYLEIPLAYELLEHHRKQGNMRRYLSLKYPKQIGFVTAFISRGKMSLLKHYVDEALGGESRDIICKSARNVAKRKTNIPQIVKKLLSEKRVSGRPDPKAKTLFRKAKESGLTTGIYTMSLLELVVPALKEDGIYEYFDHICGNELLYEDSCVSGLQENVSEGKPGLGSYLSSIGIDPDDAGFIDDECIKPLTQVSVGAAAPAAKQGFKKKCSQNGIYTPDSWEEVAKVFEIDI